MKIIIGHYHLNPGGVTKIIQSQLNALSHIKDLEIVLVCDGQGRQNIQLPANAHFKSHPSLAYLPLLEDPKAFSKVVADIYNFFSSIADTKDIIHFHNIGLGKNAALSYAMYLLAQKSYKIVNHAHDFPEDRPANAAYLKQSFALLGVDEPQSILYPLEMDNYHFGVLNSFDRQRLLDLGLPEERVQLWPNPVSIPNINPALSKSESKAKIEQALGLESGKMLVAYPVRVIRRKNIGEYILLAAAFAHKANFIVTLPPLNPVEIEAYQQWVAFCQENKIDLCFEAGLKLPFEWVMTGADVCFSTSIMEGFGMVFVEPWLWGTPVAGRQIPAVLPDLYHLGLSYPLMYDKVEVEWKNKWVDFPVLSMKEQMEAIKAILNSDKSVFLERNQELTHFFNADSVSFDNNNKAIIKKELSELEYGKRLHRLYKALS